MSWSVVEYLLSILRIESFTGNEDALSEYIEADIRNAWESRPEGVRIQRIGKSFVVFGPFDPARKTLLLAGHLDTVPGDDVGERVRLEGDRIIGRGASDMKAGVAVMRGILRPEVVLNSRFNIIEIFYDGEEGPHVGNGLHRVIPECSEITRADLAIVLEPTNMTLHLGCLGGIHADVTVEGKSAHSARPWEGENAIYKALPLLGRLAALQPIVQEIEGLSFREVISATLISAGKTRNIVPGNLRVGINVRFGPRTTVETAMERLRSLVGDEGTIEIRDVSPSCDVPSGNSLLDDFVSRFSLQRHPKQAYTDVALLSAAGIPSCNFGPGLTAQCHQEGEYVLSTDLIRALEMIETFIAGDT